MFGGPMTGSCQRLTRSLLRLRMLPPMPILITYHPNTVTVSCEKWGKELVLGIHAGPKESPFVHNVIEAYQLRETFLDVKSPGEALNWLAAAGNFRLDYVT